jgi:hypothetical protein
MMSFEVGVVLQASSLPDAEFLRGSQDGCSTAALRTTTPGKYQRNEKGPSHFALRPSHFNFV